MRTDQVATDQHHVAPRLWPHLPNIALGLLRVVAGLMFMQHGAQKFFGLLMTPDMPPFHGAPPAFTQMWFAGALELGGGFLLAIGLFTRLVGFVLAGEMAFAYFMVHAPQALFPVVNRGELAVLYCFVFLIFAAIGGGRYSLDQLLTRRHERHDEVEEGLAAEGIRTSRR